MVTLEAKAGSWGEDESGTLSVMHAEDNANEDYTGETAGETLSATDLRGVIRGRIANDSNGGGLTRDESRAGVEVNLHEANAAIKSGTNKGRRTAKSAVVATVETDGDGVYMFEGLTVGKHYYVMPEGTDLYTAVRTGDENMPGQKATDIVTHALAEAGLPPAPGSEPDIPTWDYHTSTATVDDADFVLLYNDGVVEGKVSDPSARAAHSRSVVVLRQCRTSNQDATTDPVTAATQCTAYTGVEVEASVDAKGNWSGEDLREGVYEVVPDLPAGYTNVTATGSETSESTINATDGTNTLFTQQMVELMGGRAGTTTETFHIKDRNGGAGNTITSVTIDGTACGTAGTGGAAWTPPTERCVNNERDDGTIGVRVTASTGATIRLSSSDSEASPTGTGTFSYAVANGGTTSVPLAAAGSRTFHIHVAAGDGYTKNPATGATTNLFEARRNADARLDELKLTFSGGTITLDRRELGLDPGNPDGETGPVTGAHPVAYTVDGADGTGNAVPDATDGVSLTATGKNGDFDVAAFEALASATAQCTITGATAGNSPFTVTLTANAGSTKGTARFCVAIIDSDGEATTPDANTENYNVYRVVLTRK